MEDMGPLQPGLPLPTMIPRDWQCMIIDLKDCFFSIPLHPDDTKRFALTIPSLNNMQPAARYEWVVLPQGMKYSPTICQMYVAKALEVVRQQHPTILVVHYMDDLLLAAPVLPSGLYDQIEATLLGFGLTIGKDKTQLVSPYKYLGTQLTERLVRPQKLLVTENSVTNLHQLQVLVGALQWLRQFVPLPPDEIQLFTDQLRGDTDLTAPHQLSSQHQHILERFMQRLQKQGLWRHDAAQPLLAHILLQVQGAIIILHQGQLQRPLLFGYVSVPRIAFPQWDELLALAIEWARTKRLLLVFALCPEVYGGYWQEYAVGYRTAPLFPTPYAYNLRSAEPVPNGTLRGLFPPVTCRGRKLTTIRINATVQTGINLTHETLLSSDSTTHATEDGKETVLPVAQLCGSIDIWDNGTIADVTVPPWTVKTMVRNQSVAWLWVGPPGQAPAPVDFFPGDVWTVNSHATAPYQSVRVVQVSNSAHWRLPNPYWLLRSQKRTWKVIPANRTLGLCSMGLLLWPHRTARSPRATRRVCKIPVLLKMRDKRSAQYTQQARSNQEENLMIGLIRDFAKMQNVSQVTACLPIPKSAGGPIPWGIITSSIPQIEKNKTVQCESETIIETEMLGGFYRECQIRLYPWCKKERNYIFTDLDNEDGRLGMCEYDAPHTRQKEKVIWKCKEANKIGGLEGWESAWALSILQKYQYGGNTPWCLQWVGRTNSDQSLLYEMAQRETSSRERVKAVPWWNCTQIFNCDTALETISLLPVKIALDTGCACRGLQVNMSITNLNIASQTGREKILVNCKSSTIRSMGHFVWAASDGTWTTHLSLDGPVKEITLGLPTLCPLWKKSSLIRRRTKREVSEENDEWQEPSTGIRFGWMAESLFAPIASYHNRELIYNLMGQVHRLASITRKGFKDLNIQLQATTGMTLQNRLALDMLLLKEHGVCGYLKEKADHCCIHIPNVTADIERDISQIAQVESKIKEEQRDAEQNWLGATLEGLGLHLEGWLKSLLQTILLLVIVFIVIGLVYSCIKAKIARSSITAC
uniref:ribonuclease H n=1 Tax=Anas platyrhynchos TaxID=8839 RepID=A0A8B9T3C6_ANAPL